MLLYALKTTYLRKNNYIRNALLYCFSFGNCRKPTFPENGLDFSCRL